MIQIISSCSIVSVKPRPYYTDIYQVAISNSTASCRCHTQLTTIYIGNGIQSQNLYRGGLACCCCSHNIKYLVDLDHKPQNTWFWIHPNLGKSLIQMSRLSFDHSIFPLSCGTILPTGASWQTRPYHSWLCHFIFLLFCCI